MAKSSRSHTEPAIPKKKRSPATVAGSPSHHKRHEERRLIGWREWVSLPDLGISAVKAKIDSGARSSALHAYDMQIFRRGGAEMVRFKVHPIQRNADLTVQTEAELLDQRWVKSSAGIETLRPVILTNIELFGEQWPIELTLIKRDAMGFRMLLGRQAVRGRFMIDPGRSYLIGKGPSLKRKRKKKKSKKKRPTP